MLESNLTDWWHSYWSRQPFPSGYTQSSITLLACLLTVIMFLIVVGNCLVCIAIFTEKSLKPTQNWFIASLAVSDMLLGLVVMPFSLARELMGFWMFGQLWCDIHAALDVLLCTASINTLCLISLDRYWSITQAVAYLKKRTPRRGAAMIAFVWILSAAVSLPPLFGWKKQNTSASFNPLQQPDMPTATQTALDGGTIGSAHTDTTSTTSGTSTDATGYHEASVEELLAAEAKRQQQLDEMRTTLPPSSASQQDPDESAAAANERRARHARREPPSAGQPQPRRPVTSVEPRQQQPRPQPCGAATLARAGVASRAYYYEDNANFRNRLTLPTRPQQRTGSSRPRRQAEVVVSTGDMDFMLAIDGTNSTTATNSNNANNNDNTNSSSNDSNSNSNSNRNYTTRTMTSVIVPTSDQAQLPMAAAATAGPGGAAPMNEYPACALSDDIGYVLYSASGSFYIPCMVMVFVYIKIFLAARSRARRGLNKQQPRPTKEQRQQRRQARKARKLTQLGGATSQGGKTKSKSNSANNNGNNGNNINNKNGNNNGNNNSNNRRHQAHHHLHDLHHLHELGSTGEGRMTTTGGGSSVALDRDNSLSSLTQCLPHSNDHGDHDDDNNHDSVTSNNEICTSHSLYGMQAASRGRHAPPGSNNPTGGVQRVLPTSTMPCHLTSYSCQAEDGAHSRRNSLTGPGALGCSSKLAGPATTVLTMSDAVPASATSGANMSQTSAATMDSVSGRGSTSSTGNSSSGFSVGPARKNGCDREGAPPQPPLYDHDHAHTHARHQQKLCEAAAILRAQLDPEREPLQPLGCHPEMMVTKIPETITTQVLHASTSMPVTRFNFQSGPRESGSDLETDLLGLGGSAADTPLALMPSSPVPDIVVDRTITTTTTNATTNANANNNTNYHYNHHNHNHHHQHQHHHDPDCAQTPPPDSCHPGSAGSGSGSGGSGSGAAHSNNLPADLSGHTITCLTTAKKVPTTAPTATTTTSATDATPTSHMSLHDRHAHQYHQHHLHHHQHLLGKHQPLTTSQSNNVVIGASSMNNQNNNSNNRQQPMAPKSANSSNLISGGTPHHTEYLASDNERHKRKLAKKRERRATLILGIIMAAFITAWLPFFTLYVTRAVCPVCRDYISSRVESFIFWLGYCNSAINPLIYTIFNRDFRRAFRKILFRCIT